MHSLRSLFVWLVWGLHLFLLGPIAVLLVAVSPRGLGFRFTQWGSRSAFYFAGLRVKAVGAERVDWSRPQVFMGNHQNLLDPFALLNIVPRHVAGIEKIENLKIPVYGWLSRAWGNIPIHREDPAASRVGIAQAAERLRAGLPMAIMPEGTRTKDGSIGPFKKGGFHLAIDTGADIVPFTINGGYGRLRTGDWRVYPGTIEVVFGEPIPTQGYGKENLDELVTRTREAILANFKAEALPGPSQEDA